MAAAFWLLVLVVAAPAVTVDGATDCPPPAEVGRRLGALLPPAAADAPPERATLVADGSRLRVTLRAADGTLIGERTFDRGAVDPTGKALGCDDLAAAAALAIAAWRSDVHPEYPPAPLPVAPRPAVAPGAPSAAPEASTAWELGASAGGSLSPGGAAPTLAVAAGWGGWRSGLGLEIGIGLSGARTLSLSAGDASWARHPLTAGVRQRWALGDRGLGWRLDAHAAGALALLIARGQGFEKNEVSRGWDAGVAGGLRLGRPFGRVRPWVGAAAWVWPRTHRLYQLPSADDSALPHAELQIGAGISFCLGPCRQ